MLLSASCRARVLLACSHGGLGVIFAISRDGSPSLYFLFAKRQMGNPDDSEGKIAAAMRREPQCRNVTANGRPTDSNTTR